MSTRKITTKRQTQILQPFGPHSQIARSLRPTERNLPPMPPEVEVLEVASPADAITVESEVVYRRPSAETKRRRHQSQANLDLEKRTKRQTCNLPSRGWA